jgi:Tfp pilus assembly protein PilF
MGQIYETMQRLPEAEQAYQDALSYNPNFSFARFHLARLLYKKGSAADARSELETFLKGWQEADSDATELLEARRLQAQLGMAHDKR